jgi:hypothetical protein
MCTWPPPQRPPSHSAKRVDIQHRRHLSPFSANSPSLSPSLSQLLENFRFFARRLLPAPVIVALILYRSTAIRVELSRSPALHSALKQYPTPCTRRLRHSETVFTLLTTTTLSTFYMFHYLCCAAWLLLVVRWTKASFEFERNTKSASAMYMKSERMRKGGKGVARASRVQQ